MSSPTSWKANLASSGFTGDLVVSSDPDYASAIVRYAKNAQRNAGLVAFVKSPQDVSLVIKYATANSIPVVVRGGGCHTSGTSSTNGGIVIDLSRHLKTVRVDEANKLAHVGGGADWAAVDAEAIKYGLATVGSIINLVGVGGFTLGGGHGWLTGQHGFAIDNLVQATVVTADGSTLTANESTNSDLFWGIRGGGPNFGCVTEFVFKLHPQRKEVFAGALIFPPDRLAEVIAFADEWYPTSNETEAIRVVTTNKGPTGVPVVVVGLFFNGEAEEGKQRFKKLFDLGPIMNLVNTIPYEQSNSMENHNVTYGLNYKVDGYLRPPLVTPQIATKVFGKLMETTSAREDLQLVLIWEYHNLNKFASVSSDATAYTMRVPRPLSILMINWVGDSDELTTDALNRMEQVRSFCDQEFAPAYAQLGGKTEIDTGYGNAETGNPTSEEGARTLYGPNYARLQQLKSNYDPNLVFKSWYPIQPAA